MPTDEQLFRLWVDHNDKVHSLMSVAPPTTSRALWINWVVQMVEEWEDFMETAAELRRRRIPFEYSEQVWMTAMRTRTHFVVNRIEWQDYWTEAEGEPKGQQDDDAASEFPTLQYNVRAVPLIAALRAHISRARDNEETFTKIAKMCRSAMSRAIAHQETLIQHQEVIEQQLSKHADENE